MEEQKLKMSLTTTIALMLIVCLTIVGFVYLLYSLKTNDSTNVVNNVNNTNQISNTVSNEIVE